MSSEEDRIVGMHFDNKQFEDGAKTTLSTLDRLKQSLAFKGASTGLTDLEKNAGRFNMNPLIGSVDGVSKAFIALSTIAITALANIANRAVDAGLAFASSFTIDPIKAGLAEYETNLNSIQTILANTGLEGEKGLATVSGALQKLNTYSDKTIYNFSEMARNIGTFTAAGIDLDTSVNAIKGIANLAAVSGSSSAQASTAMYQLSQALATGTVRLMDWNSVTNAGMGGKVFQENLKETARVHGVAVDSIIDEEGSFRDSLAKGWLTSEILTESLSKMTGDLTDKQLQAMGYTQAQIKDIQKMAQTAQDAATKVKTFTQLTGTLQETAGSGWAKTWQLIFGDFNEAKDLWTGVNDVLGGFIGASADARNHVLKDWKELGGRTTLIRAIQSAWTDFLRIIKPIKNAFRDIFPAQSGKTLFEMTRSFKLFMDSLKISGETMENLRRTFRGVFAVFHIFGTIIGETIGFIADLIGMFVKGSGGGILEFTGGIGDVLYMFDQMLTKGGGIAAFFDILRGGVKSVLKFLAPVGELIGNLFDSFDGGAASKVGDSLGEIAEAINPIERLMKPLILLWMGFIGVLKRVGNVLSPFADMVSNAFSAFADAIEGAFGSQTFEGILDTFNTLFLGGILLMLRKFFKKGLSLNLGGGMVDTIKNTFGELGNTLKAMQTNIKADSLLKIAAAIGIMALAMVALSMIDSKDLTKALLAMAGGFALLLTAMKILEGVGTSAGFLKIPFIAGSLILLSTAILILTGALKLLSTIDKRDLERGLLTIGALLFMLTKAVGPLAANSAGMVTAGAGMILIATALNIMAVAVKKFGEMSWEEIAKGLVGVGGGLVIIAGAMQLMPTGMVAQGAALILIAVALKILASAVRDFSKFKWKDMGKGLAGIAGALLLIAGAMWLMPPNMTMQAAALILVGIALQQIGKAVKSMGQMSWEEIAKGLVTLGGALLILAGGLYLMSGSLAGSAALLIAAAALAVLTPVLIALGAMSWESIIKGLVTLAATFVILGLAGLLLYPIVPAIIGLGLAMLVLGAGLALAGAGAMLFATAFAIVVAAGTAGISVLGGMIALIPELAAKLAEGIIQFASTIAKNATTFVKAFEKLLIALLNAIIRIAPKIRETLDVLLDTLLGVIRDNSGRFFETGWALLISFLEGIRDNIGEAAEVATDAAVAFMEAIGDNAGELADAGFKMIIDFMDGITKAVEENDEEMGRAGADLAWAIITGMVNGLEAFKGQIIDKMVDIARQAWEEVKDFWKVFSPSRRMKELGMYINLGLVEGLSGTESQVLATLAKMFDKIKTTLDEARAAIQEEKDRIDELRKGPKDETEKEEEKRLKALKKHRQALKDLLVIEALAEGARDKFRKGLKDERRELVGLAKDYDRVTAELDEARTALEDAIAARDAEAESITSQYNVLPDITEETNLEQYLEDVQAQTAATQEYFAKLQQLRAMGLSDEAYQKLVDEGVTAMPFVDQLIEGGDSAVAQFSAVQEQLAAAASLLGSTVANQMHAAGIASAQGLVAGLESRQNELRIAMEKIAREMIKAIKKELKIKSPSQAFAEIGGLSGQGLASGLKASSRYVEKASSDLGDKALETLRVTMSNLGNNLSADLDMTPVIAPVLDLTQLQKDATKIGSILDTAPLTAAVSYVQAANISATAQEATDEATSATAEQPARDIDFSMTINAPKTPSPIEVYRNTKNLLSLAQEELKA